MGWRLLRLPVYFPWISRFFARIFSNSTIRQFDNSTIWQFGKLAIGGCGCKLGRSGEVRGWKLLTQNVFVNTGWWCDGSCVCASDGCKPVYLCEARERFPNSSARWLWRRPSADFGPSPALPKGEGGGLCMGASLTLAPDRVLARYAAIEKTRRRHGGDPEHTLDEASIAFSKGFTDSHANPWMLGTHLNKWVTLSLCRQWHQSLCLPTL